MRQRIAEQDNGSKIVVEGQKDQGEALEPSDKYGSSKQKRTAREEYDIRKQTAFAAWRVFEEAAECLKAEMGAASRLRPSPSPQTHKNPRLSTDLDLVMVQDIFDDLLG